VGGLGRPSGGACGGRLAIVEWAIAGRCRAGRELAHTIGAGWANKEDSIDPLQVIGELSIFLFFFLFSLFKFSLTFEFLLHFLSDQMQHIIYQHEMQLNFCFCFPFLN
jgi:hypothetical protein